MTLAICVSIYGIIGLGLCFVMWRKFLEDGGPIDVSINTALFRTFLLFGLLWPYTLALMVAIRFSPKLRKWIETGVFGDD